MSKFAAKYKHSILLSFIDKARYEFDSISMILGYFHPQVTLAAWQEFDSQQEAVHEFVNKARSTMERDLNFSSPESLAVELDQARVSKVCLWVNSCARNL